MEFKSIVNAICRRRWLIAIVFLAFFIPMLAAVFIIQPYYSATAKVWIYRSKASQSFLSGLSLSPSSMGDTSVGDSERESWIALATTRPAMDKVIEDLGLQKKRIRYRLLDSVPFLRSFLELVGVKLPSGWRKMTHIELTGSSVWRYLWPCPYVEASQYQDSDMVEIKATAPGLAAACSLADTAAKRFIETEFQRVQGDYGAIKQFVEANIERTKGQYKHALKELEEFRKREKTVNLDTETTNLLSRIIDAHRSQEDAQLNIMRYKATWRDMLEQLKTTPEFKRLGDMEFRSSDSVTNLKNNLVSLYSDLADAATRYGPDHPQRKDIETKIAKNRENLRKELEMAVGLDSMYASLREKLVGYLSDVAGYQAQEKAWANIIVAYEKELMQLPKKLSQYARLNLDVTVATSLQQTFSEFLSKTTLAQFYDVQNLRLVDPAGEVDPDDSKPSLKINSALGLIFGVFFGFGAAFLAEYLDDSIKTGADLRKFKGPIYLGTVSRPHRRRRARVPRPRTGWRKYLRLRLRPPMAPPEECLRSLAQVLRLVAGETPPRTLLVCGVAQDEGSVFLAAGLGRIMADQGRKVLLVDTDLRAGQLHEVLGVDVLGGLGNYLRGQVTADQLPRATDTPGLSLIPAGPAEQGPAQTWDAERLRGLVDALAPAYDLVILASPPVMTSSDALLISPWVDALALVVESARTSRRDLDDCLEVLAPASVRLVGSVLYQREADVYYRM